MQLVITSLPASQQLQKSVSRDALVVDPILRTCSGSHSRWQETLVLFSNREFSLAMDRRQ